MNSKFSIRLPFLLALSLAAGIFIGANFFEKTPMRESVNNNARKFRDIIQYIEKYYVDTVDVDALTDYAIEQMLTKLDPHTAYFPPKDAELANAPLQGDFEGIGIEFNMFRDTLNVLTVVSGGPSEQVGLRPGDKIIKVDGKLIVGDTLSNRDIIGMLRGEKGSKVRVDVLRGKQAEPLSFTITRDKIPTYTVDASFMMDEKTGYLKISRFGAKTYDEFLEHLTKLQKQGMTQLILDLRDNGGGYLDKAISIADEFISNEKMIVFTDGKGKQFDEEAFAKKEGKFEKGALIVLINENSASASEIVAGALQDQDRALLVGRRSFGKGLVQKPIQLDDRSELRLTISRYYTPSGRSIQKPYSEGVIAYESDLEERYQHGELFSVDSVLLDESKAYKTAKGRTVYGGGGIMPDVFVPQDTTFYSTYLVEVSNNNLLREFAYQFANNHQSKLKQMELAVFVQSSYISDAVLEEFQAFAQANGVQRDPKGFQQSQAYIRSTIKSIVARAIWGENGFYQVDNQTDPVLQKALTLFEQAKQLEED